MKRKKNPFSILYLSIIVILLITAIGAAGYFLYDRKLDELENANDRMEEQLRLTIEDNELLSEQIAELDKKIAQFQQDDRYEELALWRRLREQLASQLSS